MPLIDYQNMSEAGVAARFCLSTMCTDWEDAEFFGTVDKTQCSDPDMPTHYILFSIHRLCCDPVDHGFRSKYIRYLAKRYRIQELNNASRCEFELPSDLNSGPSKKDRERLAGELDDDVAIVSREVRNMTIMLDTRVLFEHFIGDGGWAFVVLAILAWILVIVVATYCFFHYAR